jgi:acetyl esterase/lipase
MRALRLLLPLLLSFIFAGSSFAQLTEEERAAVLISRETEVTPNITYLVANNYEAKLDVYRPRKAKAPTPVVMVIHGGGWVAGEKEEGVLQALPYLQMGFAVVNVEYRLAKVSLAPAAVEDCLCALHWIGRNAQKYNFDVTKIITTGGSAGGHLALTTGMIPPSAGLDAQCSFHENDWDGTKTDALPKVAAIINLYGITDVADLLQGPNTRSYAVSWFGSLPNREELARQMSPLTYVRPGLPPIITIHGDADPVVPYSNAVKLHQALDKAGVRNQLVTIPGGGHGGFLDDQQIKAFDAIKAFLASVGITPAGK